MKQVSYILFLVLSLATTNVSAQFDITGIARVEEGRIIYTLDPKWDEYQKKEVIKAFFDLDSSVWQKINSGTSQISLGNTQWTVTKLQGRLIELSRNIEKKIPRHLSESDIFLDEKKWEIPPGYVDQEKVIYGFNSFSRNQVYKYVGGIVQFFLPGYEKSRRAYIAGSFNDWEPNKTAMQKVDSGWIVKLSLPPGKYFYKYILDGNWITDPNNRFEENDGQGNINSVLILPNFQFKLNGYKNAKRVIVVGSFNNWNRTELRMRRTQDGWVLPIYLKDGTYSYKFLVDDQWVTDPDNKLTRKDNQGNYNSVVSKGEKYMFYLKGFESAQRVLVAGNFNNWHSNELPLEKVSGGWRLPYMFSPGNYEYKFIIDGKWTTDPDNPYQVGKGREANSLLAYKANYTFKLSGYENANEVIVAGSFNNWNPEGYKMVKKGGVWTFPVYLGKGKHLYKFIVDGNWIMDPGNKLWEQNEYGTGNSVLWID